LGSSGAGTLFYYGTSHVLSIGTGKSTTIGTTIYDIGHPEPSSGKTPSDKSGSNDGDYRLPGMGSPDKVDDATRKLFCELNPNAPNCKDDEQDNCD